MTSHQFEKLLLDLIQQHPDNHTLRAQFAHLRRFGAPQPMLDKARHAWRKDLLITAGLRDALHLLKA